MKWLIPLVLLAGCLPESEYTVIVYRPDGKIHRSVRMQAPFPAAAIGGYERMYGYKPEGGWFIEALPADVYPPKVAEAD